MRFISSFVGIAYWVILTLIGRRVPLVANVSLSLRYKGTGRVRVSKHRKNLRVKREDRKGVRHLTDPFFYF
jgi:hypothetical protein